MKATTILACLVCIIGSNLDKFCVAIEWLSGEGKITYQRYNLTINPKYSGQQKLHRQLYERDLPVRQILRIRLKILKHFAFDHKPQQCQTGRFVYVSEYPFGNSGNNLVEFTHGLWLARQLNATFIVPEWMRHVLEPFDTTLLKAHYCYRLKPSLPQNKTLFEITSEESFFLFQLFYSNRYRSLLPPLNETTIADLSLHFLKVYAGLWCCPLHETVAAADWLIHNHLHNSLRYVSVHKRQMEGGCSKTMAGVTQPADFSPRDLPMQRREWRGPLASSHPLCEMPLPFLRDTMDMHHRNCSDIFVAWDGRGDVSSYRREGAVFSDMLDTTLANHRDVNLKFVDMFLAIHSDLFLLNPRSTFSWQIYLVRVCLGLFSVPVVRGNDLYLQRVPDELGMSLPPQPPHLEGDASLPLPPLPKIRPLWVSWTSVIDAYTAEVDSAVGKEWLP